MARSILSIWFFCWKVKGFHFSPRRSSFDRSANKRRIGGQSCVCFNAFCFYILIPSTFVPLIHDDTHLINKSYQWSQLGTRKHAQPTWFISFLVTEEIEMVNENRIEVLEALNDFKISFKALKRSFTSENCLNNLNMTFMQYVHMQL